jgi:hypothetical protein
MKFDQHEPCDTESVAVAFINYQTERYAYRIPTGKLCHVKVWALIGGGGGRSHLGSLYRNRRSQLRGLRLVNDLGLTLRRHRFQATNR